MVIVYPGNVRKPCWSCEDFMNEWEKIYEYVYHRKKVCYTTEYQSERGLKEQFREDKKKKER